MLERDMTRVECLRFEKNRSRPSVLGITRASNRFERHGKQHHPDEEDRRSTRLQVTAEGMAVFGHLHAQGAQLSGVAMADLKHGEREQLISLLRRVHERLQSAPDE